MYSYTSLANNNYQRGCMFNSISWQFLIFLIDTLGFKFSLSPKYKIINQKKKKKKKTMVVGLLAYWQVKLLIFFIFVADKNMLILFVI